MKKVLSLLGVTLLLAGGISASAVLTSKKETYTPTQAAGAGNYYDGISDSLTGDSLLRALNSLNNTKRKSTTTYAGMRTSAKVFDADPDGSGKIISFYTNDLIGPNWDGGSTWNREHVWPNARGGSKVEGDAHMTRPASTAINSERGSKGYSMQAYDPGQYVAYYRGAAARIIFYAAIADTSLKIIDEPLNYDGSSPANSMGCLSELLQWNLEYQPSDTSFTGDNDLARRTELNRNEQIQNASIGQGNRNPFIDHPEYACRIWGNTNSKTKEVCKGVTPSETADVTGVTLDKTSAELSMGDTLQLNATVAPENATNKEVVWSTSNSFIATVSNTGLVTAVSVGTVTITVTTVDGNKKATCELTIKRKEDSGSGGGTANVSCGGNIIATSVILSSISLVGIALLLVKKFKDKR